LKRKTNDNSNVTKPETKKTISRENLDKNPEISQVSASPDGE